MRRQSPIVLIDMAFLRGWERLCVDVIDEGPEGALHLAMKIGILLDESGSEPIEKAKKTA